MITPMRRALRHPVFRGAVAWAAILGMMFFWGGPSIFKLFNIESGVITVDDVNISAEQFKNQVQREQQRISEINRQYGSMAKMMIQFMGISTNPTVQAYKVLENQALLEALAKKYNIKIDDSVIDQKISQELSMLPPGSITPEMAAYIDEYRAALKEDIKKKMILDFVLATAYVPEFELKAKFQSDYGKKDFTVLILPFNKFFEKAKQKKVSEKDLTAFYNKNKTDYFVAEKRDGVIWNFSGDKYGINIKEDEIQKYYDKNKHKFIDTPVKLKVARILISDGPGAAKTADDLRDKILKDPSKFEELAKANSIDKESAENGGLLEPFKRGEKDSEFEKAAFALSADEPISKVAYTKDGFEIIKLIERKKATFKDLKSVTGEIKVALEKERFKKLFPINAKKAIYSKNKKEDWAKLKEKGTQGINYKDMQKSDAPDIKKLFGLKEPGDLDYIQNGDTCQIIELEKISASQTPALKDIKEKVEADYYKVEAKKLLEAAVATIKKELSENKKIKEIASKSGAEIKNIDDLGRQDHATLGTLANQGIPGDKMLELTIPGSVGAEVNDQAGLAFTLKTVKPLDETLFESKKNDLKQGLLRERKRQIAEGFVASLKKDAKITINDNRLKIQLKDLL